MGRVSPPPHARRMATRWERVAPDQTNTSPRGWVVQVDVVAPPDDSHVDGCFCEEVAPFAAPSLDRELVVEVEEMLLDRGLSDEQRVGDVRLRCRLLGARVCEVRTAQFHEYLALATRHLWCSTTLDRAGVVVGVVAIHERRAPDADLVAVAHDAATSERVTVHPGSVPRSQVLDGPLARDEAEQRVAT